MRDYIKSRGVPVSPAQLALLVPAFDAAWAELCKRVPEQASDQALRDRVAKLVVDLVMSGESTDPKAIAAAAVRLTLES
jgi:hypothetical protein